MRRADARRTNVPRADTRRTDMARADMRRTDMSRADMRGTEGTRTTSAACRKAAVPAAMTPDSRAVTAPAVTASASAAAVPAPAAGVSFERQERNHEEQRRGDASAGRQQRPRSAMGRGAPWRCQRRRMSPGISQATNSFKRHGHLPLLMPPLNIVPPVFHGVGMMKRRSVVATFAIYIGTTAGAAPT